MPRKLSRLEIQEQRGVRLDQLGKLAIDLQIALMEARDAVVCLAVAEEWTGRGVRWQNLRDSAASLLARADSILYDRSRDDEKVSL